jgi:hypothetical protein
MIKYFRVDNTGWSFGVSWFEGHLRFSTFDEAKEYYKNAQWGEGSTFWRIAEVTIEYAELDNSRVAQKTTKERYLYLS